MNENSREESGQYLTFLLGSEVFGFDVLRIKEVLEITRITKIPKTPPFMAGVINLRGGVVPVIDLRLKFEMDKIEETVDTSIIIVEVIYEGELILIGALVDAVRAVIKIEAGDLEPPPKVGMQLDSVLIDALGKSGDHFIIILNIDRIFSAEELSVLQGSGDSRLHNTAEAPGVNLAENPGQIPDEDLPG